MMAYVNVTDGGFEDEASAQKWIADFLREAAVHVDGAWKKAFKVYEQVSGTTVFRHHLQTGNGSVRADILAIPQDKVIETGVIAIEVKRSDEKIGPGISQLSDYLHSVFLIGGSKIAVLPTVGFLFPCPKQHQVTASWMQQQHIGSVSIGYKGCVTFWLGEQRLLEFECNGWLSESNGHSSGKRIGCR